MTYYEELGVAPAASVEEIRQAYKTLARLLHPDQHPEGPMREMAERQMKRLNLMLEVLTDAAARARYDHSLEPAEPVPDLPRPPRGGHVGLWIWGTAALLGVAGIGWFLSQEGGVGSRPRMAAPVAGAAAVAPKSEPGSATPTAPPRERAVAGASGREAALTAELAQAQRTIAALRAERDDALQQIARQSAPQANPDAPRLPATAPPVDDAAPPTSPPPAAGKPAPRFAGDWLYVKPAHPGRQRGLYPPEYIELKISERDNVLWGSYHARYLVADRAISPVVAFEFEGRAEAPLTRCAWTGAGGARGQVTLKLNSADAMEVSWRAEQMGAELGLTSGVATLVRRQDR